jgi:hypothetical protein
MACGDGPSQQASGAAVAAADAGAPAHLCTGHSGPVYGKCGWPCWLRISCRMPGWSAVAWKGTAGGLCTTKHPAMDGEVVTRGELAVGERRRAGGGGNRAGSGGGGGGAAVKRGARRSAAECVSFELL